MSGRASTLWVRLYLKRLDSWELQVSSKVLPCTRHTDDTRHGRMGILGLAMVHRTSARQKTVLREWWYQECSILLSQWIFFYRRKRGESQTETPGRQIVQKLCVERMEELRKLVQEEQDKYRSGIFCFHRWFNRKGYVKGPYLAKQLSNIGHPRFTFDHFWVILKSCSSDFDQLIFGVL